MMDTDGNNDVSVLGHVSNAVRSNSLKSHRQKVLNEWKRKECIRMKKELLEIKTKNKHLLKKKKKLTAACAAAEVAYQNYATMVMKGQILEKKRYLVKLRAEMQADYERHKAHTERMETVWNNLPKIKEAEEIKQAMARCKLEKEKALKEIEDKKKEAQQNKQKLQQEVVQFIIDLKIYHKTQQVEAETQELDKKIAEVEKKIAELKLRKKSAPAADEPAPPPEVLPTPALLHRYDGVDLEIFDDFQSQSVQSVHQESANYDDLDDLDCSVLSLDASMDTPFLDSGSLGALLHTISPVAASTPKEMDTAHQQAEDRALVERNEIAVGVMARMSDAVTSQPLTNPSQLDEATAWPSPTTRKPQESLSRATSQESQSRATSQESQSRATSQQQPQSRTTSQQEPQSRTTSQKQSQQATGDVEMRSLSQQVTDSAALAGGQQYAQQMITPSSEKIGGQHYIPQMNTQSCEKERDSSSAQSLQQVNVTDTDDDYISKYAKSPEQPSETTSSPTRSDLASNYFQPDPPSGAPPMSFFNFGPSEPQANGANIFNLF